jgi:acetyltransferase-like isoleucine patch superfamily enzyme
LTEKKANKFHLMEWLWWLGAILIYGLAAYPVIWSLSFLYDRSLLLFALALPLELLFFILVLLIFLGLIFRLVPRVREGEYPLERSGEVLKWMICAGIVNYVRIIGLSRIIYSQPLLRRVFFWAFGAKVHPSAVVAYEVLLADPYFLEIKANAKIGDRSKIIGHISDTEKFTFKKVIIEENVIIGANSGIMPGVTVGRNSIIGADSVVTSNKVIPPDELWMGRPAKRVKSLAEDLE